MKDAQGHGSAGTGRVKPFRPTAKNWAAAAETARKTNELMQASQALGQDHPKSAAVPMHDAFANARRDANGDIVSLHPKPTKEERAKARAYKETLR